MSVDSRYIRIATKFWQDEKARRLSDDAKLLYLYVLTSPHSNMAGYYVLPKPYVAYDLQWLPERLDKALAELLRTGLIKYCEQNDVVFIPNFFKYNPIQNRNQAVGVAKRVSELPANTLQKDFLAAVKRFAQPFLELFAERLTEWFGNTETETDTETDTDTETETETESKPDPVVSSLPPSSDDLDIVLDAWRQHIGELGPKQLDAISAWLKESDRAMPAEVVVKAIEIAAQSGVRRLNYVEGILRNWLNDGVRTLEDIERAEQRKYRTRGAPAETRPRFDREAYVRMLREEGLYREARPS